MRYVNIDQEEIEKTRLLEKNNNHSKTTISSHESKPKFTSESPNTVLKDKVSESPKATWKDIVSDSPKADLKDKVSGNPEIDLNEILPMIEQPQRRISQEKRRRSKGKTLKKRRKI